MKAARTRIGRVTMKNGGADVRVLHANPSCETIKSMREWVKEVSAFAESPDAYVAIAFWASESDPSRQPHYIGWQTESADFPLPRLMRNAAAQLSDESSVLISQHRVMKRLGYEPEDDAS